MKKSYLVIIIIAVIILLVVVLFKPKNRQPEKIDQIPTPTLSMETPVLMTPTDSSKYSPELKAKVRSEFINTCHTKGKYTVAVCTCGADYLSANYSESDLAKMYLQYHTSNVVPKALEIAAEKCSK
jgi:hypothetical protein